MSSQIPIQSNSKAGLCPHGLPPSACPICSGSGATGGAVKMKDTPVTKPVSSNQWSWMKCYIAGLNMRSDELRLENTKQNFEHQLQALKNLQKSIDLIADKLITNLKNIQNSLPEFLKTPFEIIFKITVIPIINLISQLPKILEKLVSLEMNVKNFINQAAEKLSALLGDFKNFLKSKVEDIKKNWKKLFFFFNSDIEDENYKNDEALAVFKSRELKKYLLKILKTNKKQGKNDNRSNKKQ